MIPGYLSLRAEDAALRYGFLIGALDGLYRRGATSPAAVQAIMKQARDLASTYLTQELDRIDSDLAEIATIAQQKTIRALTRKETFELSAQALEHLHASGDYLRDELLAQISRDVATLRKGIQKSILQTGLADRLGAATSNLPALHFQFHDRASRKWSSSTFVRTTWRHTLLSVYNETVLITLADHGVNLAQVDHEDPSSPKHGRLIAITPDDRHDTYIDVRDELFHPNAHSVLKVPDVQT